MVSLNGIESSFVGVMHVSSDVELFAKTGVFTSIALVETEISGSTYIGRAIVHGDGVTVH